MIPWDTPIDLPVTKLQGQGFARRAVAYIIDNLIYIGVFLFMTLVVGLLITFISYILFPEYDVVTDSTMQRWVSILLSIVLAVVYFASFEWLFGATPGKVLMSMRVVSDDGRPCGFKAAIIRAFLRYIDALFFAIPAYASMSSDERRQRLGDKAAHTVVVNKHDPLINGRRQGWNFLLATLVILFVDFLLALAYIAFNFSLQSIQPLTTI